MDCSRITQIQGSSNVRNPERRRLLVWYYFVWNSWPGGAVGEKQVLALRWGALIMNTHPVFWKPRNKYIGVSPFFKSILSQRLYSYIIGILHICNIKVKNHSIYSMLKWRVLEWVLVPCRNRPSCDVSGRWRTFPPWRQPAVVWGLYKAVHDGVLAREPRVQTRLQIHQIPPKTYAAGPVSYRSV